MTGACFFSDRRRREREIASYHNHFSKGVKRKTTKQNINQFDAKRYLVLNDDLISFKPNVQINNPTFLCPWT